MKIGIYFLITAISLLLGKGGRDGTRGKEHQTRQTVPTGGFGHHGDAQVPLPRVRSPPARCTPSPRPRPFRQDVAPACTYGHAETGTRPPLRRRGGEPHPGHNRSAVQGSPASLDGALPSIHEAVTPGSLRTQTHARIFCSAISLVPAGHASMHRGICCVFTYRVDTRISCVHAPGHLLTWREEPAQWCKVNHPITEVRA